MPNETTAGSDGDPLVVVTGLPRSGTSLLMQMLAAGGIPVLTDGARAADESNPRGYLEYEPVRRLASDNGWLASVRGRAVKIILQLMPHVPDGMPMLVLCLDRPVTDVVSSQASMLQRLGRPFSADPAGLAATFSKQRARILDSLRQRPATRLLEVPFQRLLARDPAMVREIAEFLGRADLDQSAMLAAVDPALHRTPLQPLTPERPAARRRLPWQEGKTRGLIVVSVPKSGTNFLSRYLSSISGWRHRWGRPSRDRIDLLGELPQDPDPAVAERALHLIRTASDIAELPADQRPALFGNRRLLSLEPGNNEGEPPRRTDMTSPHGIIAEHPVRSLPWFLRNPSSVPLLRPEEVIGEAAELGYGVVFLYRDLRDVANSLAHFLHAGTRFVHFPSFADSLAVVVSQYIPVLAAAIRLWRSSFPGRIITYEDLVHRTRPTLESLIREFDLPAPPDGLVTSTDQFRSFTFRKGGSGDWRNHLPADVAEQIGTHYPELIHPDAS